jgi:hypothetical protein
MIHAPVCIQHQLNHQGLTARHLNKLTDASLPPKMSGLCFPCGFALTLEAKQCTQLWLGAKNLASLGAGMVASGSDLICHVIA